MKNWRVRLVEWCETALGGWVFRSILAVEKAVKYPIFGCRMCGQCVLSYTGYVCPMRCPKEMRNGPCGGAMNGRCEVHPDQACVWCLAVERARLFRREDKLELLLADIDWSRVGTSSWLNHLAGRDDVTREVPPASTAIGAAPSIPRPGRSPGEKEDSRTSRAA